MNSLTETFDKQLQISVLVCARGTTPFPIGRHMDRMTH